MAIKPTTKEYNMKTFQTILLLTSLTMGGGVAHGQGLIPQIDRDTAIMQCTKINPKELCECLIDSVEFVGKSLGATYANGWLVLPNDVLVLEASRRYKILSEGCYTTHAAKVK